MVEELGLQGQQELAEDNRSPVPYLFMNRAITRVFETLCPKHVGVEAYGKTPIPVEVLGHVKLAEREKYFEKIEVWYNQTNPDPVIVGKRGDDQYLIARWGDVDLSFPELVKLAKDRWAIAKRAALETKMRETQAQIDTIDALTDKHFAGEYTGIEYI
jgi:hypothetical protein